MAAVLTGAPEALPALNWKRPTYHHQAAQRPPRQWGGVSVLAVCHPVNASERSPGNVARPPIPYHFLGAW